MKLTNVEWAIIAVAVVIAAAVGAFAGWLVR